MNLFHKLLFAGLALLPLTAQTVPGAHAPLLQISLDSVDVDSVGSDHANLSVKTSVIVGRNVTVTRIRFESMRLEDIPFFLNPVEERMELIAGRPVSLPAIPLTVYYRDLDSLQSLEAAVRRGEVLVNGHARADLDLGLMDRLAIRQWHGHSELPIHSSIPLNVPGGAVGRAAAVATIRAAQTAMTVRGSALNVWRSMQNDWTQDLNKRYAPALVLAEARYSLLRDGQRIDMTVPGLGFRMSGHQFLLTGEMLEPWKFDPEVALLLELHEATVIENSSDLLVWPGYAPPPQAARRLSEGEIRIDRIGGATRGVVMPYKDQRVNVRLANRDSSENMVVLSFTGEEDGQPGVQSAPAEVASQQNWDRLALFRMGEGGKVSVIFVAARRKNDRLVLESPVDESAFGSPLIAREGIVAMVQEERSAIPVAW
jgi:hypothetical protein